LLVALLTSRLAAPRAFSEAIERLVFEAVAAIWRVDKIPTICERTAKLIVRLRSA
jgi:hypothetical protein